MSCRLVGAKPLSEPMLEHFLIGRLETNASEMLIAIHTFSFKKMHLKMSSFPWPQCVNSPGQYYFEGLLLSHCCYSKHSCSRRFYCMVWTKVRPGYVISSLVFYGCNTLVLLTHWGRDKMDAVSQTTLWSAFSSMKMFEFLLKFHWSLFLRVQLTIFHHWFR